MHRTWTRAWGPETGHLNLERRLDSSLGSVCCDMSAGETCLPCNPHLQPSRRDQGLPTLLHPDNPTVDECTPGGQHNTGRVRTPPRPATLHWTNHPNSPEYQGTEPPPQQDTTTSLHISQKEGEHPLLAAVFERAVTSSPRPPRGPMQRAHENAWFAFKLEHKTGTFRSKRMFII